MQGRKGASPGGTNSEVRAESSSSAGQIDLTCPLPTLAYPSANGKQRGDLLAGLEVAEEGVKRRSTGYQSHKGLVASPFSGTSGPTNI